IDLEQLTTAIENHAYKDLHDRLYELGKDLRMPMELVIHSITGVWASSNEDKVQLFFVALKNRGIDLSFEALQKISAEANIELEHTDLKQPHKDGSFKITFDGNCMRFSPKGT